MESVLAMLDDAKLPKELWGEALKTALYLQNRSPNSAINNKTPFELWTGKVPNLKHLRTFGSIGYVRTPVGRTKLDPKAKPYTFIGYSTESKAYKLADLEARKVILARDVQFLETSNIKSSMKTSEKGHVDQEFTKPKYSFSPKMTSDDKLSTLNEERQNLGEIIEK